MQDAGRITSIAGLEDTTTSQIIADDADWLEKITIDESDYDLPSHKFDFKLNHAVELPDEDADLIAHLWDRDHASDLDGYEWRSEDLVSEAYSHNDNTSDEELPRVARKDLFEQGIRREETWTREYRERWEEDHIFYKRKIQERLGVIAHEGEAYEGYSYVSKGAWSAQAGEDWGTPDTSSGLEWTTRSEDPWTAGDGWAEWKGEDQKPWTKPDTEQTLDEKSVDEAGSAGTDEHSGELCFWKRSPSQGPMSGKSAYKKSSSTSIVRNFSNSTHTSSAPSYLCNGTDITDLDDSTALSPPPPSSQIPETALRMPKRTSRFRDPELVSVEAISCSEISLDGEVMDRFLDTCIAKTRALLRDGNKALNSKAKVEQISALGKGVSRDEQHYLQSSNMATKPERDEFQARVSKKSETAFAEIVRVDGWWKVKGGETWREVGEDECATLCEYGDVR